jgi:hypothetical protein
MFGVIIQQLGWREYARGRRQRHAPGSRDVGVQKRLMVRGKRFLDDLASARHEVDTKFLSEEEGIASGMAVALGKLDARANFARLESGGFPTRYQ